MQTRRITIYGLYLLSSIKTLGPNVSSRDIVDLMEAITGKRNKEFGKHAAGGELWNSLKNQEQSGNITKKEMDVNRYTITRQGNNVLKEHIKSLKKFGIIK